MALFSAFPSSSSSSSSSLVLHGYNLYFAFLAFVFSAFLFLASRKTKSRRLNLPPGPPGWPIVGNLFQFATSGKPFFKYADELRQKYGPIYTLKMGTRTMIIISDAKLCHEALIDRGYLFATRPAENPTRTVFSCNKFTVNAALYGPIWRSLRRNMVQNMLCSSKLKEFRHVRDIAMDKLVERIRSEADATGFISVLKTARFAVFCILLTMSFGIEMDEETIDKMDQMMKTVLLILDPRIDDYLPILSPFFSKQRKRAMEVRKEQVDFVSKFIEQRRKALGNPGSDKRATSFSYLDTLFDLRVEGRKTTPSNEELVSLCSEFLNGGTDTTATAIEWGIAELIANPQIQSKLYAEIKQTVGVSGKVNEKDIDEMEYLQAIVKELLRKHPPTYFSLTHAVTESTTLAGYDIPTNTNVEIYLPGISKDPKLWEDPEKFDPNRFLSGKERADMTGSTGVKTMPFGIGRRICPGLGMATLHVSLTLARMVQEFEWSANPTNSELDFTGKLEFTVVMKNPLRAMVKPRGSMVK